MDVVTLNLRGTTFITERDILKSVPGSRLCNLNKDSINYVELRDEYFFNRNPAIFHHILDYYMTGKLHIPNHICAKSAREELKFWGIPQGAVEKCCWKKFYQIDDDMNVLGKLLESIPIAEKHIPTLNTVHSDENYSNWSNVRTRIWKFLNESPSTGVAKIWCVFLYLVIVLSVTMYILQGVPMFRRNIDTALPFPDENNYSPTEVELYYWNTTVVSSVFWIDTSTNFILTVEWTLRIIVCPHKLRFFTKVLNVTDLMAIISYWFGFWYTLNDKNRSVFLFSGSNDLVFLVALTYACRILRIFRLMEHNTGTEILLLSLRSSARELCILALSFVCFSLTFGTMIFLVEYSSHKALITNFLDSVWWSIITMTTVGYGDYFPTTGAGYVVGAMCAIVGILLIALPVAVTSSNFYDFYTFNKYRMRYRQDVYEQRLKRCRKRTLSIIELFSGKKDLTDHSILSKTEETAKSERSFKEDNSCDSPKSNDQTYLSITRF